jgi:hypothetical protein
MKQLSEKKCTYCGDSFFSILNKKQCSNRCYRSEKRKSIPKVVNLENEIWKPVVGYEDIYNVSCFGRIKRIKTKIYSVKRNCYVWKNEHIIAQNTHIYKQFSIRANGKMYALKIHRVIAEAFIPNPENKPCVNHINGIKTDNRIENLEWCTFSENTKHAYSNGLIQVGKLKEYQVLEIFKRAHNGENLTNIAKEFNVHKSNISDIKNKKIWKNIL